MESYIYIENDLNKDTLLEFKKQLEDIGFERVADIGQGRFVFQCEVSPAQTIFELCDDFEIDSLKGEYLATSGSGIFEYQNGIKNEYVSNEANKKILLNSQGNWAYKTEFFPSLNDIKEKLEEYNFKSIDHSKHL